MIFGSDCDQKTFVLSKNLWKSARLKLRAGIWTIRMLKLFFLNWKYSFHELKLFVCHLKHVGIHHKVCKVKWKYFYTCASDHLFKIFYVIRYLEILLINVKIHVTTCFTGLIFSVLFISLFTFICLWFIIKNKDITFLLYY